MKNLIWRVDMNNALKAKAMNSHLKIASVLVLSIGSLAVGFVAGNRGGDGGVFIPPEDNPPAIEDSNLNGLDDRFVVYYKGIQLEPTICENRWVVESYDLVELTSGDLTIQFQEYVNKEWVMIDEYPIQFTICSDCNGGHGSGVISQDLVDNLCLGSKGCGSGTFILHVDTKFGGATKPWHTPSSFSKFGVCQITVEFSTVINGGCKGFMGSEKEFFLHTVLPNPSSLPRYNNYDINALNQQVDLLWEYINALEKCATDVNRDAVVDVNDLLEVVADWGNICETPKGK